MSVAPEPAIMMRVTGAMRPKEDAECWYAMYKPDGDNYSKIGPDGRFMQGKESDECCNCLVPCLFPCCAHGLVYEWATDGKESCVGGCICAPICGWFAPCCIMDTRKKMEQKIFNFHQQRGGALKAPAPREPSRLAG